MDGTHYQNTMSNNEQLLDTEGPFEFLNKIEFWRNILRNHKTWRYVSLMGIFY